MLVIDARTDWCCACVTRCGERLGLVLRRYRSVHGASRYLTKTLDQREQCPSVVVLDAPADDFLEIAERVHRINPLLPILFVAEEAMGLQVARRFHNSAALRGARWIVSPPQEDRLCEALAHAVEAHHVGPRLSQAEPEPETLHRGGQRPAFIGSEILPQMIWSAQADGVIDHYNRGWSLFAGVSQAELLRVGWQSLTHPEDRTAAQRCWEQALRDGQSFDVEVRLQSQTGEWQWHRLQAEPQYVGPVVNRWFGTCIPIYEHRGREESGPFLSEVARRVTESLDYELTLTNLAQVVVPVFADWCTVDVVGPDGQLERRGAAHIIPGLGRRIATLTWDTKARQMTAAEVVRTGEMQLLPRIEQSLIDATVRDPADREFLASLNLRSLMRLPLCVSGRTVGVISFVLLGSGSRRYTEADVPLAKEIAQHGALAVENARLYRTAREELEERKRAEAALVISENRYRSLMEATTQIVWVLDAQGRSMDDTGHWRAFTGQSVAEVAGWGWLEAVGLADKNTFRHTFLTAVADARPITAEVDLAFHGGSYRRVVMRLLPLFDSGGGCREWIAAATDITHERTASELLEREKERLAVTLNSLGEGVITTDTDGCIVLFNRVAQMLTGWPQQEALGKALNVVFCASDVRSRVPLTDPADRVLRTGELLGPGDRAILRACDGTERVVAYTAAPVRDRASRIAGVVIVFRDISSQQKLEEDFLKAQKLESVGVLAGGIAHDFNNILTAVIGNIALAKMYADAHDRVAHALSEAEKAAWRARGLTQQLLTFAKGGAPVKKPGSLADLLREAVPFALAGSNVKCTLSINDDLWTLAFDPGQLSQAINNLVINATQAMPSGGLIHIRAENAELHDHESIPLPAGRYVHLVVSDEGVGIASDHVDKIFDPYFTTKEGRAGLGLATTYSIIRRHEGVIRVQSEEGSGTRFDIFLPAQGTPTLRPLPEKGCEQGARILVMDDEPTLLQVVTALLRHLGYQVEVAQDGSEAIARYEEARQQDSPFGVVILDLTVPAGMGGKECLKRLREIDPGVRAIVSSGYYNDPIVSDYRRFGFSGAITKPYQLHDLSDVIRRVFVANDEHLR